MEDDEKRREPFAQTTASDLRLPITALALRILLLLRLRCWSRNGPKARMVGLEDVQEAIGEGGERSRGALSQGREAVAPALSELVQLGLVQATPQHGNRWVFLPTGAEPRAVPDEELPARFRRTQKSERPTSKDRKGRLLKIGASDHEDRRVRSRRSARPIVEIGASDRRNRRVRLLKDALDRRSVDPVDGSAGGLTFDQLEELGARTADWLKRGGDSPMPLPPTGRAVLDELKRRHVEFQHALPEARRKRVPWLVGTPSELEHGCAHEQEWLAEVVGGDLELALRLLLAVFDFAWRQASEGKLDERQLTKSLWGNTFAARTREWVDARRSGKLGGVPLTPEALVELEELAARATERLRPKARTGS